MFLMIAAVSEASIPPVPGLCMAPVPADRDTPGCYQTGTVELDGAPSQIFWQIYEFPTLAAAQSEANNHRWASVAEAHSKTWLYVLGDLSERVKGGVKKASVGPLTVPSGIGMAHFSEAIFPPGMRTRVHSHPGPEAFYVVEGEQCMETPSDKRLISAGGTYIVENGPHIQAAPKGRRNLVLILAPKGVPAVFPGGDWKPTGFCDR
jgi:quercetin dioxygenase-like cupin family protein